MEAQPALLAQHCQEAGLAEQAVVHWLKAAQQALSRLAMAEAATQTRKGLETLSTLPDGPWHRQHELDLQLTLGWALRATKGYSTMEAVETLARAQALAEQLDRPEYLVPLMVSRWGAHLTRAEYRQALSLGKQIEDVGKYRNNAALHLLGRLVQGMSLFQLGELIPARALLDEHADPAYRPVDPPSAHNHALRLAYAGRILAALGYIDQARSRMDAALSLARGITRSAPTLAQMLTHANALDYATGSPLIHADELSALSTEQQFSQWLGWALAYRGFALAELGQAQEAFALLTQALAQLRAIGTVNGLPRLLVGLANISHRLGRSAEAWRYLAEAAQILEATDERVSEAEVLYRVPGDLLNAAGDQSGAEQHYRQARAFSA